MSQDSKRKGPLAAGRPRKRHNARKAGWGPRFLIMRVRVKQGLTQKELADAVGTTPGHISDFETGKRNPSWGLLNDIAVALGCKYVRELIDPNSVFGARNKQPVDLDREY